MKFLENESMTVVKNVTVSLTHIFKLCLPSHINANLLTKGFSIGFNIFLIIYQNLIWKNRQKREVCFGIILLK